MLFFTYSGDLSISQELSNELIYRHPDLVVIIGYIKGNYVTFSLRGKINILNFTKDCIKNIEGASGGGHEHATGVKMTVDNVVKFRENIEKWLKTNKIY